MTRQLAAGLLCFLYASGAAAQTGSPVTDVARLEGTWTLDIERSGVTESERRVITLGPTWIRVTIHRAMDDHPPVLIYNLDGSKGLNPFGDGTATTALYREPTGLRTETVYTIHDRPTTVSEVFRLNAAGDELVVETTVRVEHGYQGVTSALDRVPPNVSQSTMIFRKTPTP